MKKLVLVLLVLIGVSSLVAFQVIEDNTIKTENVIFQMIIVMAGKMDIVRVGKM